MKLDVEMNISKMELYNFLLDNLKKEMNVKEVKEGMKFNKNLLTKTNQSAKAELEIFKLVEGKEYTIKYNTILGANFVKYFIEELGENKIKLIYEEKYETSSHFNKYNGILMEILFGFSLKRKKKKMLKELENYIIQNREVEKND